MRLLLFCLVVLLLTGCPSSAVVEQHPKDSGSVALEDAGTERQDAGVTQDAGVAQDAGVTPDAGQPEDPTLPLLHNHSGASKEKAQALAKAALAGLGFTGAEAPGPQDRVFVGRHYLAWLDQTGFYGKMNGLWVLNGEAGDALDFLSKDPDGRPVSFFVPGENGDGKWPAGYQGAEHLEFPSRVPEANDNASCASGDWCNQYGLNEAVVLTNAKIPWWTACNAKRPSFSTKYEPFSVTESAQGLEIVWEAPLVKQADGDGTFDGDACGEDYLFPDGVRRRVWLRVGYQLYAYQNYFDRTLQLVNPSGNPQLKGDMSVIGGFVVTQWPSPSYLKSLQRFWRPEQTALPVKFGANTVNLSAGTWNDLRSQPALATDVLVSWAAQPLTLSASSDYLAAGSATLDHVGMDLPADNRDVGACLCSVHGGLELGGGLLHAGMALPLAPGQMSIVARRRLTLHNSGTPPAVRGLTFEAEAATGLSHNVGRAEADGWSAATGPDVEGHMAFGPYATDWGSGTMQATFRLLVDNTTGDRNEVVQLELYDATAGTLLTTRPVYRYEFRKPYGYETFTVSADLRGAAGHKIETRVWWRDVSYVRLDKVDVKLAAIP